MSVRIENESFAGDAFMRHPIFLCFYVPCFSHSSHNNKKGLDMNPFSKF